MTADDNTGAPLPHADGAMAKRLDEVSSYTLHLSSNFSDPSALCPREATFAHIEPYGAIVLFRFTSGEHAERFELSAAEVDALVATNRRRRSLIGRYLAAGNTEPDGYPY